MLLRCRNANILSTRRCYRLIADFEVDYQPRRKHLIRGGVHVKAEDLSSGEVAHTNSAHLVYPVGREVQHP